VVHRMWATRPPPKRRSPPPKLSSASPHGLHRPNPLTPFGTVAIVAAMGLTVLNLEVANPAALERREEVEFLVDSGAVYSFVPRAVLERLGIQAHSRQVFRLADGSTIERDRGDAVFFYRNARGAAPVIFAEAGDATLLGAVSLESLGYVLDAVRRDLVRLPMVIAAAGESGVITLL